MGRLTRNPELKYLPSQTPVVKIGLACNRKYKSKDGAEKEEVCFIDAQMYGKRAETKDKYFKKGGLILISGRLQQETWTAKDGTKRSKHLIFIENFEFVGGKQEEPQRHENTPAYAAVAPPNNRNAYIPSKANDDIPF